MFVWSHTPHKQAIAGETMRDKTLIDYRPTRIGSSCFIGGPSVIGPGVTIGDRVIISPMSFVERDVPTGGVVSNRLLQRASDQRLTSLESEVELLRERLAQLENGI